MLLERPGQVVLREEIQKKLWPNDTIVEFDHSINAAVKRLRRALGDDAETPRFVETLPRRGYRFMYPLNGVARVPAQQGQPLGAPEPATPADGAGAGALSGSPSNSSDLIGKQVSHYRVLGAIGSGGMGVVYRAEDIRLGRPVALKFLPEELTGDPRALERFKREARATSTLNHPNICTIYEVEEHEGKPFIVMELLEGQTVRELLASRTPSFLDGPGSALRIEELVMFAIQIADGLDAAHQKGIIHRDIKPANIFITREGQAKILDFGVAKVVAAVSDRRPDVPPGSRTDDHDIAATTTIDRANLTIPGSAMGTIAYMSPEQARGEKLDARTDLFSFGAVLYEMATGKQAFTGSTTAAIHDAILNRTPAAVTSVNSQSPPELERIVNKALEKDRDLRYQVAGEIRSDLNRLKRDVESALDTTKDAHEPVPDEMSNRPAVRGFAAKRSQLLVAVLAILVIGAAIAWYALERPKPKPELIERQLTTNSSELSVWASAISPDGRYLAYSDDSGIHLNVVDTAETHALPAPPASTINDLAWFPDGTKLLVGGEAGEPAVSSLWTVSILGGNPQKLRDDAADGSVFENGAGIVFLSGDAKEIWQMGPGGEDARKVMTASEGESFGMPVGAKGRLWYKKVVVLNVVYEVDIESVDLKGGPPTVFASNLDVTSAYFLLPNRRLIYSRMDRPELFRGASLWAVQADFFTGLPRGQPRRIANWPDFQISGLSGTTDGERLAFLKENVFRSSIYVGTLEGNGLRIVNPHRLTLSDSADEAYAWTPDSRSVLFDSNRNGTWDIFRQALDQRTAERIVASPGGSIRPAMAPEGMSVLYLTLSQPVRIMRVALTGGPTKFLGDIPSAGEIRCARTANLCVVSASGPKLRVLYALDPEKGKGREVLRTDPALDPSQDEDWDLSPDGSSLAFIKGDAQRRSFQIQVRPLAGGVGRELNIRGWGNSGVSNPPVARDAHGLVGTAGSIRWAADGKGWYVTRPEGHTYGWKLLKVDLTGKATQLGQGTDWGLAIPSPDGLHAAVTGPALTSNVWMLENF
jgi:serine/threonine protein kinase